LLQPQDRRSRQPGDAKAAVAARRRLHDLGVTAPLLGAIRDALQATAHDEVLDAGCGDGFYLGTLARETGCRAHGIDISTPAIEAAARRYPDLEWVVANADRFVPYSDGAFTRVMSITARMNAAEFLRVMQPEARLVVAVPSPDDLVELRGDGKDRVDRTVAHFAPLFRLEQHRRASTTAFLEKEAIQDLLLSIYRPLHANEPQAQRVTFSLDILSFHPAV
jgi:23S rRNA (guanine745-N1)-methyltransferase